MSSAESKMSCPGCSAEMEAVTLQSQSFMVLLPTDFLEKVRECNLAKVAFDVRKVQVAEIAIIPEDGARYPFYSKAYWCRACKCLFFRVCDVYGQADITEIFGPPKITNY